MCFLCAAAWESDLTGWADSSINSALELGGGIRFYNSQWFVCRKRALSLGRGPFFFITLHGASGQLKFPHLHPGKLYSHVCANTIFLVLSVGWIHCYTCLRFLLQPEEAVHQKFMPVSLQWAQLLNEIDLSAWKLKGGQNFRPIYFLLGECKADMQKDTVCLHAQTWSGAALSM